MVRAYMLLTGKENSPLKADVTQYLQNLDVKIKKGKLANDSPGFFPSPALTQPGAHLSLVSTFFLSSSIAPAP